MKTRFDDFDTQVQCDELIPTCPFCDEQLDGDTIDGMHAGCYHQFGIELDEAFPDVTYFTIEPSEEFLPISDADELDIQIDEMLMRFV